MQAFIKPAYAAICNPVLPFLGCGGSEAGGDIFGGLIGGAIAILLIAGAILTMIYLVLGGLRWITAGADKQKLQTAQDQITHAIIGLIILAAVWAVMTLVSVFLGLGQFGPGGADFPLPILNEQQQPPPQTGVCPGTCKKTCGRGESTISGSCDAGFFCCLQLIRL